MGEKEEKKFREDLFKNNFDEKKKKRNDDILMYYLGKVKNFDQFKQGFNAQDVYDYYSRQYQYQDITPFIQNRFQKKSEQYSISQEQADYFAYKAGEVSYYAQQL